MPPEEPVELELQALSVQPITRHSANGSTLLRSDRLDGIDKLFELALVMTIYLPTGEPWWLKANTLLFHTQLILSASDYTAWHQHMRPRLRLGGECRMNGHRQLAHGFRLAYALPSGALVSGCSWSSSSTTYTNSCR